MSEDVAHINVKTGGINIEEYSDLEKVVYCLEILEQVQSFLDTADLRFLTSDDLRDLEKRISTVIISINKVVDKSLVPVRVRRYILQNARNARTELFNALDTQAYTEKERRSFYRCLTKCQDFLSDAVWRLRPIASTKKETSMTGLEPIATAALTKAVDFLFDQAGKLMEERRENRRKLGEEDDSLPSDPDSTAIANREGLKDLQPKTIYLKDNHREIEHCLKQIHQYRSNKRHTLDQIAHQGGMSHASIGMRNDLITAEDELRKWSRKLKEIIEKVYGHKITIVGLD